MVKTLSLSRFNHVLRRWIRSLEHTLVTLCLFVFFLEGIFGVMGPLMVRVSDVDRALCVLRIAPAGCSPEAYGPVRTNTK